MGGELRGCEHNRCAATAIGVYDLRPALDAAAAGGFLNARQLDGIASSLEAASAVKTAVMQPRRPPSLASTASSSSASSHKGSGSTSAVKVEPQYAQLARLGRGIVDSEQATIAAIRSCIRLVPGLSGLGL